MNLNFSKPFEVKTPTGKKAFVIEAHIPPEFWGIWRTSKHQMSDNGYYLTRKIDSLNKPYWMLRRYYIEESEKITPIKVLPYPVSDPSKLLHYQIPAVGHLKASMISNRVALDCSDTGTGKTYTSLKTVLELGMRPGIICTKTGIADWKEVCNFYGLNPLFIINWESAKSTKFIYTKRVQDEYTGEYNFKWLVPPNANVCIIFDEVHRANGEGTQNQKLLLGAADYPIIGLSATLADKLSKLRSIGILCGLFTDDTFNDWLQEKGLFKDNHNNWKSLQDKSNMLEINKLLFPAFGTRIRKADIPDFPDVQNIAKLYPVAGADKQNAAYMKLQKQIAELKAKSGSDMQSKILVLSLRYKQLTEHLKIPLLIELIKEKKEEGLSVAVFVNFSDTVIELKRKLKTNCFIVGGQKPEDRRRAIDDFQADNKHVIICNIKAGGIGISLHDIHGDRPRVALICPSDNATEILQAMGRIHRAGAKSKAINYLVYAARTVEEKIYKNMVEKIQTINTLNDGENAEDKIFDEQ